jgi:hypothetical protein
MTEEIDLAALREQLTRAYLSGDGAAVVRIMDLIAAAEQPQADREPAAA